VLEVGVPDGPWGRTLPDIVPGLVARFAARNPALGVRRYRLVSEESGTRTDALPLPPPGKEAKGPRPPGGPEETKDERRAEMPVEKRLGELMERYVARSKGDARHGT
jgi:hypothetical protein